MAISTRSGPVIDLPTLAALMATDKVIISMLLWNTSGWDHAGCCAAMLMEFQRKDQANSAVLPQFGQARHSALMA
ncbi:MAG: hypothetical protein ACREQ2_19865 [Candidatus Binatia bacterium]